MGSCANCGCCETSVTSVTSVLPRPVGERAGVRGRTLKLRMATARQSTPNAAPLTLTLSPKGRGNQNAQTWGTNPRRSGQDALAQLVMRNGQLQIRGTNPP